MSMIYETDLGNLRIDDVDSRIVLAEADNMPFSAMIGASSEATQMRFDWLVLRNTNPAGRAYKDAETMTVKTSEKPVRVWSYTQEIREGWGIGRKAEKSATHGKSNSATWQKKQALLRLARMRERLLCSFQEQAVESASGGTGTAPDNGSMMRGLLCALLPKTVAGQTVDVIPDAYRVQDDAYYGGALAALTPELFEDCLEEMTEYMGDSSDLMGLVGIKLKRKMSSWTAYDQTASGLPFAVNTRRFGEDFDFNTSVSVFKFDAATVRVALSRQLGYDMTTGVKGAYSKTCGAFFKPEHFTLRQFQPLSHTDSKEYGEGRAGFYSQDIGLQTDSPCAAVLVVPGLAAAGDSGSSGS